MKKFIDEIYLKVKSGNGGNGAVSFERYKYKKIGKPDGGDGGRGGHIIIKVNPQYSELSHLKKIHLVKAEHGGNGGDSGKKGKDGQNNHIMVPPGVLIKDYNNKSVLEELINTSDEYIVAQGGRGGRGNTHFKSSTNRSPRQKEEGKKGIEKTIIIELKLLGDIGLIGFPNAGKSTLLKAMTDAKPEVGQYPFTTLAPNLGVFIDDQHKSYTIADIPGIIEEAHKGKGLGLRFLKHIERTKILAILVDCAEDYKNQEKKLLKELKEYNPDLLKKEIIYIANKIDMVEQDKLIKIDKKYIQVSALKKLHLDDLKEKFLLLLKK